ncbi:hypothetical protein AB0903_03320 [Streptomyces sp. NPDC048389]|uniref:hypothetical protein n=1 Tax=Streptomyces sp. NPDC048389 TaxID=3154622 RepID=UPI0034556C45
MSDDYRPEGFENRDAPLPRDMQDQQAGARKPEQRDEAVDRRAGEGGDEGESGGTGGDVPEADEAGAGSQGSQEESGPGTPAPEELPD